MADKTYPNGLQEAIAAVKAEDPEMGPTKLARLTKMNKQTVARYIARERKLTVPMAEKFAPHLKTTAAELLQVEEGQVQMVPVLSMVSAGKLFAQEGVRNVDAKKRIAATDLPKGRWIALEVQGDSMDRVAPDGAIIFVNQADEALRDDKFYVFSLGNGEATFKRYRGGATPRLQPYSTNPDHETIFPPEDLRVIGRVRRVLTDLK